MAGRMGPVSLINSLFMLVTLLFPPKSLVRHGSLGIMAMTLTAFSSLFFGTVAIEAKSLVSLSSGLIDGLECFILSRENEIPGQRNESRRGACPQRVREKVLWYPLGGEKRPRNKIESEGGRNYNLPIYLPTSGHQHQHDAAAAREHCDPSLGFFFFRWT